MALIIQAENAHRGYVMTRKIVTCQECRGKGWTCAIEGRREVTINCRTCGGAKFVLRGVRKSWTQKIRSW